ncbi:MAG: hypothetical protein ACRCYV_04825 [Aeromonas sp.]
MHDATSFPPALPSELGSAAAGSRAEVDQLGAEPLPLLARELSWLSFNARVLQEAEDRSVPLIERLRFLGIFAANQDEFFKVRVADIKRRILIHEAQGGDEAAKSLLRDITRKVLQLEAAFEKNYGQIKNELALQHIYLLNEHDLGIDSRAPTSSARVGQISSAQSRWLRAFFKNKVLPLLTPILLNKSVQPAKFLKDEHGYLAVELIRGDGPSHYALLGIPSDELSRFIVLPREEGAREKKIIMLDDLLRFFLQEIFSLFFEYDVISAYAVTFRAGAHFVKFNNKYTNRINIDHL